MEYREILKKLKDSSDSKNLEGMKRFGINSTKALGVAMPVLRKIAREIGRKHEIALKLWETEIHEARILASMVDEEELVDNEQMEKWVKDFNSWDVCDQVCLNLFERTKYAYEKCIEWSSREEEFVKRSGFALIAVLAVRHKAAKDEKFIQFFPLIKRESADERNFVKKAVNWALRQIGKRNVKLNKLAIKAAKEIQKIDSRSAKWIASDALRELLSEKTRKRMEE